MKCHFHQILFNENKFNHKGPLGFKMGDIAPVINDERVANNFHTCFETTASSNGCAHDY